MTDNAEPEVPLQPNTPPELSAADKRELLQRAQHLSAIVQVGPAGLTPPGLAAINRAFRDHELVKVRLREPEDKHAAAAALAEATQATLCGLDGHMVILFKPKKKPKAPKAHRQAH